MVIEDEDNIIQSEIDVITIEDNVVQLPPVDSNDSNVIAKCLQLDATEKTVPCTYEEIKDVGTEVTSDPIECISEIEHSQEETEGNIILDVEEEDTNVPESKVVESTPVVEEHVTYLTVDVEAEVLSGIIKCISETEVSEEETEGNISPNILEQDLHTEVDFVESSPVIDEEASHLNVDVEADVIAERIECISEIKVSQEETEENTILDVIEQDTHLAESDIVESIPVVDEEICHLSAEVQPTDVETEVNTEPIECVSEIEVSQQETDASICPDTLGQGTHMPELHVVESSPVIDEEASHLNVDVEADVIAEPIECISPRGNGRKYNPRCNRTRYTFGRI